VSFHNPEWTFEEDADISVAASASKYPSVPGDGRVIII
jgi:hypothetical protein